MAKGTITLSGSTVGTKMESLEVEQSATGGVQGALKVDNNDTDKVAFLIEASNINQDVIQLSADALTTGHGIYGSFDGLTTHSALFIDSDSSSTSTRNVVEIINNNTAATGATALSLQSDAGRGLFIDSNLAAGGYSFQIDAEQTTSNTVQIASKSTSGTTLEISAAGVLTGKVVDIRADAATTGRGIDMSMDALTTGSALYIDSDSSSTGTRNIVDIIQNHASATGATVLNLQQDAAQKCLTIDQNGNQGSIFIDSEASTTDTLVIDDPRQTTGTVLRIHDASVLTTGKIGWFYSNSSDTSVRNLVEITNDNTAAVGAVGLKVQQDSGAASAIFDGGQVYVRKGSAFQTHTTTLLALGY